MVCDPLSCIGLNFTFNFLNVTVCDSLLCNGLDLTFNFLHMTVHGPVLCNGLSLILKVSTCDGARPSTL